MKTEAIRLIKPYTAADVSGVRLIVFFRLYDAWGKPLTCTGALANSVGTDNPLRYRGYIYDEDTGLYYLETRYYDPEIGRFINADGSVSGVGGEVLGYNMFIYCFNNPVNMSDSTGKPLSVLSGRVPAKYDIYYRLSRVDINKGENRIAFYNFVEEMLEWE